MVRGLLSYCPGVGGRVAADESACEEAARSHGSSRGRGIDAFLVYAGDVLLLLHLVPRSYRQRHSSCGSGRLGAWTLLRAMNTAHKSFEIVEVRSVQFAQNLHTDRNRFALHAT